MNRVVGSLGDVALAVPGNVTSAGSLASAIETAEATLGLVILV